jgi:hypothetical protein
MDVWKAGSEVHTLMSEILKRHHVERLYDMESKIAIIFREKSGITGGRIIHAKTRKASPLLKVLHPEDETMFLIEIGAEQWLEFSDKEKEALLDHHLCSIHVEESKEGARNFKIAPPDFVGYKGEIERHGVWRYLNTHDEEDEDDVIDQLFGPSSKLVTEANAKDS